MTELEKLDLVTPELIEDLSTNPELPHPKLVYAFDRVTSYLVGCIKKEEIKILLYSVFQLGLHVGRRQIMKEGE